MPNLLDLPGELFGDICKHLETAENVLSFQSAHSRLNFCIDRCFWGVPKSLLIGAEATTQIVVDDGHKLVVRRPTETRMTAVVSKMRNMKELFLSKDDPAMTLEVIGHVLTLLQDNELIKLEKIVAVYNKPESFIKSDKSAWPKKRVHDQLSELIAASKASILFFGLGIDNSDDFVSVSRSHVSDNVLLMDYNHESTWESRQIVFFPLLNKFASACSATNTLNIRLRTAPNMAHILADHCVFCAASSNRPNKLEHINIRFTMRGQDDKQGLVGFDHFHNVRSLQTLVWTFDTPLSEEVIDKICCPAGPCVYDVFVDTPQLKKTFPGSQKRPKFDTTTLLRCIS